MHAILFAVLLSIAPGFAHEEHTSEWNYIEVRWPRHIGPLIDEVDPDAYIHQVVGKESTRLNGWNGRQGSRALDTTTACGLHFDGYLRQRPYGTYVILIVSAADKQEHKLKWIPVEYRFDNEKPRYFSRRGGSPNEEEVKKSLNSEVQQQAYTHVEGRPDAKSHPELYPEYHKYLFDDGKPTHEYRTRGTVTINPKFKYLEVVKFPDPKELTTHDWLQVYLPWVEGCDTKPDLEFNRNQKQEVVWDGHMRGALSVGAASILPFRDAGWEALRPSPSYYLRFAYLGWAHQGFTVEVHATSLHDTTKTGGTTAAFLTRHSYGYAFWPHRYLTLSAELGFRGMISSAGTSPGWGGGLNLAWEVPRTRHHSTGQRLIFEGGCDLERNYGGPINNHDVRGAWGNCKIGFGLGW